MSTRSCAVCVTIFSNGSILPPGFKFTELHALTLAAGHFHIISWYQLKTLPLMQESAEKPLKIWQWPDNEISLLY